MFYKEIAKLPDCTNIHFEEILEAEKEQATLREAKLPLSLWMKDLARAFLGACVDNRNSGLKIAG